MCVCRVSARGRWGAGMKPGVHTSQCRVQCKCKDVRETCKRAMQLLKDSIWCKCGRLCMTNPSQHVHAGDWSNELWGQLTGWLHKWGGKQMGEARKASVPQHVHGSGCDSRLAGPHAGESGASKNMCCGLHTGRWYTPACCTPRQPVCHRGHVVLGYEYRN